MEVKRGRLSNPSKAKLEEFLLKFNQPPAAEVATAPKFKSKQEELEFRRSLARKAHGRHKLLAEKPAAAKPK